MGTGRMVKDKQDRQSHYPWMIYIWFIYSLIHLFVNFTCLLNFHKFTKHNLEATATHFVMQT